MKTITFQELKKLSFCNKLDSSIVIHGTVYDWTGIGLIQTDEKPDEEKHLFVVEDA